MKANPLLELIIKKPYVLGHLLGYANLKKTHGNWIHWLFGSKDTNASLLMAHRGSYKTTVVIVGIIWYFIFWPNHSLLLVRKEYSGVQDIFAKIRSHLRSEKMRIIYLLLGITNDFHLVIDRQDKLQLSTANSIKIGKEGNLQITSVYSQGVTGQHYHHIHLDDVVAEQDRYSYLERRNTERFFENLRSVVHPGGRITATGTPWHPKDLYNKFRRRKFFPIGSVDIVGMDKNYIASVKNSLSPTYWNAQYMLKHKTNVGLLFNNPKIINSWPEGVACGHIDAAYGGRDRTAVTVLKVVNKNMLCVRGKLFSGYVSKHYLAIISWLRSEGVIRVWCERNADKGMLERDLRREHLPMVGYHEHMRKHIKIVTTLSRYWNALYFHKDCDDEYIEEIKNFFIEEEGEANGLEEELDASQKNNKFAIGKNYSNRDDAPDSLASLLCREPLLNKIKLPLSHSLNNNFSKNNNYEFTSKNDVLKKNERTDISSWKKEFNMKLENFLS